MSRTIKEVFEGGIYGKVKVDLYPRDPRKENDCVGTLIGLTPRTEYLTDQHASRYGLLEVVRQHPRFRPNWENEDHRAYRDFSDIAVLADTARQLGFLVLPIMDVDTSGYGSVYLGRFDDNVDDYNCLMYVPQFGVWKEWGKGPAAYRKARNYMLCEIDEYISYLQGDVFGAEVGTYHVDANDPNADEDGVVLHETHAEEVWGLVGLEWAEAEMNTMIHGLQKHLSSTTPVVVKSAA